jgi:pyrroloquinoline quinone (PQQ) biosynthesis protein C
MSFFIRLLETTDASRCELEQVQKIQAMLNGKMTVDEYKAFLQDMYYIVQHFCPIMKSAASRCSGELVIVRDYLERRIVQESGREENILKDLAVFSVNVQGVEVGVPTYPVQAMLAYNYYACEHIHPCCVVGMLYALELISSVYGGQLAAAISLGLNMTLPNGFTFLESHSAMELDHVAELRSLLQKIDDPSVQQIIINAIQMNFYLFIAFLKR